MKPLNHYLSLCLRQTWKLIALCLVTLAVLISLLRLALPYLDDRKAWLEDWIAAEYGTELRIGSIDAAWQGLGPALILRDIELATVQDTAVQLEVAETAIELDFWATLASRQINATRFNLQGLELQLDLELVRGEQSDVPIIDALKTLFLEQLRRFSVRDGRITITSNLDQQPIEIQQLSWINKGERHQGVGKLRVQELASNSANFTLDLYGKAEELRGAFYAQGRELDLSPWLKPLLHQDKQLSLSRANFLLWADISQSQVETVRLDVQPSEFRWRDQNSGNEHALDLAGGEFRARPTADGWLFQLHELTLTGNGQLPLLLSLQGRRQHSATWLSVSEDIEVEALLPLVSAFTTDAKYQQLAKLQPQAELRRLRLRQDDDGLHLLAELADIQVAQSPTNPGIQGLNAQLFWSGSHGHVQVNSELGELLSQEWLGKEIDYDNLAASVYISNDEQGWEIVAPNFALDSRHIQLSGALRFRSRDQWLALQAKLGDMQLSATKTLLPKAYLGDGTLDYLQRSLVMGQVQDAGVVWHGSLRQFPYANHQGVFQAGLHVANTEFDFDPSWPTLRQADIDLLFENNSLAISTPSAVVMEVQLNNLNAVIPNLHKDSYVSVQGHATGEGDHIRRLMQNSSLANSVGKALDQVAIEGALSAEVDLHIPLTGIGVVAKGDVGFNGNNVHIQALKLDLNNLQGQLDFTNEVLNISGLQAELFGQPLQLSVQGEQRQDLYHTDIKLSGHWRVDELLADYHPGLNDYLGGIADWRGNLSLGIGAEKLAYDFQLNSDLPQLTSALPAPLTKQTAEKMRLLVNAEGNLAESKVRALVGQDLRFSGTLKHRQAQFDQALLTLGEPQYSANTQGFVVAAKFDHFPIQPWFNAVSALVSGNRSQQSGVLGAPERIWLSATKAELAGQQLNNLELNGKQTELFWQLDVDARELHGEAQLYHDWFDKGASIQLDYVNLPQWQRRDDADTLEPQVFTDAFRLPPVQLHCDQCQVDNYNLGQVDLRLAPMPQGIQIQELRLQQNRGQLQASGDWYLTANGSSTRLTGDFNSGDFGALLKDMGLESGIRDSSADMQFDLSWQQAPHQFNLASLNGEVSWELDDGYLADVSDKGARIFSILSLDSLLRKLTLDFRDVFSKGFFYNSLGGTFAVSDGVVSTEDTRMNGVAGDMSLVGQTDLNNGQLNYDVAFRPKITSSLPVIVGWLAGSSGIGLAALAIDEVIKSAKVVSELEYKLTGTLDNPVLSEVGRESREVPLPARTAPAPDSKLKDADTLPRSSSG